MGVDNSPEMLAAALADFPEENWIKADIASWRPASVVDLVYSNAALHWLDDHETLFPILMRMLKPGGALAVQMPANFEQPTHTTIADVAHEFEWSADLEPTLLVHPVSSADAYSRLLSPISGHVDIWTTTYLQRLTGPDAVTEWISGSALRPVLAALPAEEQARFRREYTRRVNSAYQRDPDGVTLLPFTRIFIIATARTD